MDKTHKKLALGLGALIILALVFFGGYKLGTADAGTYSDKTPIVSATSTLKGDFSLFWNAVNIVKEDFYKPERIEKEKLLYGAIKGMVNSLDDPYSTFLPPEDAQKFSEDVTGSFGGIGAQIGVRDGSLVIISPLKGNPAEEVGLKAGDEIVKINDTFTTNITLDEAVKKLRGKEGTDVTVTIMREGWEETKDFTITRDTIKIPTLDWEMRDGKIAYMQLYSFNANAPARFYEASLDALLKGAKGIILDLRNNSGGFLDVGINIAGWFVDSGDVIVQQRFPSGETTKMRSEGSGVWSRVPVVVLVNEGSASASEIVAGAIRDQIGGTVVGETTFGKGTVQELETLGDGSKLKLSVAEWLTPAGNTIHETGITPDVKVKFDGEISGGIGDNGKSTSTDPQLEKALEIIREKAEGQNPVSLDGMLKEELELNQ